MGDAFEAIGVFAVLLIYRAIALVAEAAARARQAGLAPSPCAAWPRALIALAAIAYALGSGIHLAANSIHDMLDRTALGDPWGLAYFWDEGMGHVLVDASRISFAIALTWLAGRAARGATRDAAAAATRPAAAAWRNPFVAIGALAYGFIYFAAAVEGQTVPMALPFCVLYAAWGAARKSPGRDGPIPSFFLVASWTTLILLAVWGARHGGFPEFSRVGFGF